MTGFPWNVLWTFTVYKGWLPLVFSDLTIKIGANSSCTQVNIYRMNHFLAWSHPEFSSFIRTKSTLYAWLLILWLSDCYLIYWACSYSQGDEPFWLFDPMSFPPVAPSVKTVNTVHYPRRAKLSVQTTVYYYYYYHILLILSNTLVLCCVMNTVLQPLVGLDFLVLNWIKWNQI